jgi:membrane-associated protease RseP (regulator of RpoE activity)
MKNYFTLLWLLFLIPVIALAQTEAKEGRLGVYSANLSKPMAIALNVDNDVIVTDIADSSPAAKGGIEIGDVIMKLDGEAISNQEILAELVRARPNKKVEIELLHKGKIKQITLTLGALEANESPELRIKIPSQAMKKAKKYWKEIQPYWEKGVAKYQEEIDRLREELKELRAELKELKKQLDEKIKEKGN